jgi:xanthosine utilization system XapX-like protein
MNPTLKKAIDVTTVAGAAVLIVNSALEMTKSKDIKGIVFPLVGIFVGVAAMNYAMNAIKEEPVSTAYTEIEL